VDVWSIWPRYFRYPRLPAPLRAQQIGAQPALGVPEQNSLIKSAHALAVSEHCVLQPLSTYGADSGTGRNLNDALHDLYLSRRNVTYLRCINDNPGALSVISYTSYGIRNIFLGFRLFFLPDAGSWQLATVFSWATRVYLNRTNYPCHDWRGTLWGTKYFRRRKDYYDVLFPPKTILNYTFRKLSW